MGVIELVIVIVGVIVGVLVFVTVIVGVIVGVKVGVDVLVSVGVGVCVGQTTVPFKNVLQASQSIKTLNDVKLNNVLGTALAKLVHALNPSSDVNKNVVSVYWLNVSSNSTWSETSIKKLPQQELKTIGNIVGVGVSVLVGVCVGVGQIPLGR